MNKFEIEKKNFTNLRLRDVNEANMYNGKYYNPKIYSQYGNSFNNPGK